MLAILGFMRRNGGVDCLELYAIARCTCDLVKLTTTAGGVLGIAKK